MVFLFVPVVAGVNKYDTNYTPKIKNDKDKKKSKTNFLRRSKSNSSKATPVVSSHDKEKAKLAKEEDEFYFSDSSDDEPKELVLNKNHFKNMYCPRCHNFSCRTIKHTKAVSLYFVPVVPLGRGTQIQCTICNWRKKISSDAELEEFVREEAEIKKQMLQPAPYYPTNLPPPPRQYLNPDTQEYEGLENLAPPAYGRDKEVRNVWDDTYDMRRP